MHASPMLALRSVLLLDALDERALEAAASSAADAIAIDLAGPFLRGKARQGRRAAVRHAQAIATTGRSVLVRVSDARSGALEEDVESVTAEWLTAVLLPGAEAPQDARDADVQVRKHEMRRGLPPGGIRLIPEVDSAEALLALPRMLAAVDRHSAVALHVAGLLHDLGASERSETIVSYAMAQVAVAAHATGLPWLVTGVPGDGSSTSPATAAHEAGAVGAVVGREVAVRGMNALFTPLASDLAAARALLGESDGANPAASSDRRAMRRARNLVALADAIARRERVG